MKSTYKIISALAITGVIVMGYVMTRPVSPSSFAPTPSVTTSHAPNPTPVIPAATQEAVVLSGTYVCLPHLNASASKTDCAFGIKTDDGIYYAVNFGAGAGAMSDFKDGTHITAKGFITPKEKLVPNNWAKFSLSGLFTLTEKVE